MPTNPLPESVARLVEAADEMIDAHWSGQTKAANARKLDRALAAVRAAFEEPDAWGCSTCYWLQWSREACPEGDTVQEAHDEDSRNAARRPHHACKEPVSPLYTGRPKERG